MYRIAIDVGGTFTDVVCVDAQGSVTFVKATSTPADQSRGVIAGLDALAGELGQSRSSLLTQTERIVHGTPWSNKALAVATSRVVAPLTSKEPSVPEIKS